MKRLLLLLSNAAVDVNECNHLLSRVVWISSSLSACECAFPGVAMNISLSSVTCLSVLIHILINLIETYKNAENLIRYIL